MRSLFAEARLAYLNIDTLPERQMAGPAEVPQQKPPMGPEQLPVADSLKKLQSGINGALLGAAGLEPAKPLPVPDAPREDQKGTI
jgi:hypothetical protein